MNNVVIPINYIERKPDSDKYRIVGKGVTVEFLALFIDNPDWTVEQICDGYGLTPAEVHAAWSFYYDHQAEIDQRLADDASAYPRTPEDDSKREKMLQRYAAKHGHPYQPDDSE
ncbi:MAG: DUF433 domain-containing protein [Anaerolineae bacterium]|nr:DUF433 domain-containing protein [Anaerolineae bacterium]